MKRSREVEDMLWGLGVGRHIRNKNVFMSR